jgi:lysophospholipase L1-like esterase
VSLLAEVILLGDVIRRGYQGRVVDALSGRARVWAPDHASTHSVDMLEHLHRWITPRKPSIVHLNAGLHDVRTAFHGSAYCLVPLAHYRDNLSRIFDLLASESSAQVLWATTTPVLDQAHDGVHGQWRDASRHDADVQAYNACARELCAERGVIINDLYRAVEAYGTVSLQSGDGLTYNETGYRLLGDQVARVISDQLDAHAGPSEP